IPKKPDLGDAPDSTNNFGSVMHAYTSQGLLPVLVQANYPTVFNDGSGLGPYGPVHRNPIAVANLGKIVTHEVEADIGLDQDGVNNIDPPADSPNQDKGDDGVIFPVNMPHCRWTTFDYIINVADPNIDLWVNVWCDWNRDGDWDDTLSCPRGPAMEWAVQNQYLFNLPAGLNQITTSAFMSWHPNDGPEEIWMRITLSEQPWRGGSNPELPGNGGSGPKEKYEIGETEDYYFAPDTICSICEDLNGDGIIDIQDLILYVTEWFDNCL
ncbi:MAG: GEVED domain-containing protein, partial [Planctomycetota bacterium]